MSLFSAQSSRVADSAAIRPPRAAPACRRRSTVLRTHAAQLAARDRRIEHGLQRPAAGREPGKQCRVEQRDAGIRVAARLGTHATSGVETEVAARVVLGVSHQHDGRALPDGQRAVVEVGEHVGVHEQERRRAEQRQRVHDAAGRLERRLAFLAVGDRRTEPPAIAEVVANLRTAIREIDDDPVDSARRETRDVMLDQRHATYVEQRFRVDGGERTHTLAASGCENHRSHRKTGMRGHGEAQSSRATVHPSR